MLSKLKEMDFYRKIPKDLTETSVHGAALSLCACIFMLVLFIAELWAFLSTTVVTNVVLDPNSDPLIRINFNITGIFLRQLFFAKSQNYSTQIHFSLGYPVRIRNDRCS